MWGGCHIYGIDISSKQIELAKKSIPNGKFKKMDILNLEFEKNSFDGIIAFYAIIHINREKHLKILKNFYTLLKKSGYLMICMGLTDFEGEEEFLGTIMFWSHYNKETNIELIKKAGFEIIWEKEWSNPKDFKDKHLFVFCKK